MKPREVTKENSFVVWFNLYEKDWKRKNVDNKFSIDDKVRKSTLSEKI